ncbi:regulatory protein, luxR family [Frankineae bacterium MT45]|nr:regulatory protein, luxR family [Frankineae bacterium MT45]
MGADRGPPRVDAESDGPTPSPAVLPGSRQFTVIAPAESSLAVALRATLVARGWEPRDPTLSGALHRRPTLPALVLVEDDDGQLAPERPDAEIAARSTLRGFVCLGSVRSLPLLVPLAARGAMVLNQAIPFTALVRLIEQAFHGGPVGVVDSGNRNSSAAMLRDRLAESAALQTLTPAEAQTLRALQAGLTATQIAVRTQHSVHTIRSQIKAVLGKLDVTSQVAAVALAHRVGPADWMTSGVNFTNFGDGGL